MKPLRSYTRLRHRRLLPVSTCRHLMAAMGMHLTTRSPQPLTRLRRWTREALAVRVHQLHPQPNRSRRDVPSWIVIPDIDDSPATWAMEAL